MHTVNIPKKNGKYRTIYIPSPEEARLLKTYLPKLNALVSKYCKHAHGFVEGRSPVTAALKHCGYEYTLCWDIKDFFDSVSYLMVSAFIDYNLYTKLTVDGVPRQGLPTSPLIANLSAVFLDDNIVKCLNGFDAVYTRYADDLTISFNDSYLIKKLLKYIPIICYNEGFEVNKSKTRVQSATFGRRVICGVVVGDENKTYATRKARRRLRAAEHQSKLPVKHREKAKKQADGLREWCRQRVPVQSVIDKKTGGKAVVLVKGLLLSSRREKRFLVRRQAENFPIKHYLAATSYLNKFSDSLEKEYAIALAATFGYKWRDWIKGLEGTALHDAIFWLPSEVLPEDGLGERLFVWRKNIPDLFDGKTKKKLLLIASHWSILNSEERKLSFSQLAYLLEGKAEYPKAKSPVFASEAANHSVSSERYYVWERRWLKAIKGIKVENIPKTVVKNKKYLAEVLDKKDPRALFIGEHTNCCQHPDGVAANSAWHSVESPDGKVLAIKRDGEIIAQSWLWRSGDILVADNCEALSGHYGLHHIYEIWGKSMLGKLGIKEVRIGKRSDFLIPNHWPDVTAERAPGGCYTDARSQSLICKV